MFYAGAEAPRLLQAGSRQASGEWLVNSKPHSAHGGAKRKGRGKRLFAAARAWQRDLTTLCG